MSENIETEKPTASPADGETTWKPLMIPECGIDFRRYKSADCDVYICAWRSSDNSASHVYEVRMHLLRVYDEPERWIATLSNDGRKLCTISAASRQLAYRFALGAMRAYLRRGHRKALRTARGAVPTMAAAPGTTLATQTLKHSNNESD